MPCFSSRCRSPPGNKPALLTQFPPQITTAHTIFVSNGGGSNYFNAFTGGPDRGYTQLLAALEKWNRYQIVQSPSQADLIFEIHATAPALSDPDNDIPSGYNPQLVLRIRDPKTNAILWTSTANVRAIGTQKSRDRGFDKSIAVLVDHVRQLTASSLPTLRQRPSVPIRGCPPPQRCFLA